MEISENSWHSRLLRFMWDIEPKQSFSSLCPYFWVLVGSILLVPIIGSIVLIQRSLPKKLKAFAGIIFITPVVLIPIGIIHGWHVVAVIVVVSAATIGGISLLTLGIIKITEWYENRKNPSVVKEFEKRTKTTKTKKPNIMKEFIKAKKGKYCPRLDWKSE